MQITGEITKILDVEEIESKSGESYKKVLFVVETEEEFNNLYCFEIFGEDKVDKFIQYNKVGGVVDVDFNVKTNEWNGKYFTSLSAWKVFKAEATDDF